MFVKKAREIPVGEAFVELVEGNEEWREGDEVDLARFATSMLAKPPSPPNTPHCQDDANKKRCDETSVRDEISTARRNGSRASGGHRAHSVQERLTSAGKTFPSATTKIQTARSRNTRRMIGITAFRQTASTTSYACSTSAATKLTLATTRDTKSFGSCSPVVFGTATSSTSTSVTRN